MRRHSKHPVCLSAPGCENLFLNYSDTTTLMIGIIATINSRVVVVLFLGESYYSSVDFQTAKCIIVAADNSMTVFRSL